MAEQQQPPQDEQRTGQILAAILAAGLSVAATQQAIAAALAPYGVTAGAAQAAYGLIRMVEARRERFGDGPAQRANDRAGRLYRAMYLLNAARRISTSPKPLREALRDEARFFAQHVAAQRRRDSAAEFLDTLGTPWFRWHAVLDARTSAECRAANGHIYRADRIPAIGLPGSVHPHCRCFPEPVNVKPRTREPAALVGA